MPAPEGNQNAIGNDGGRPLIHTEPESVQKLIIDYFEWINGEEGQREIFAINDDGDKVKKMETYWVRKPEPPTVTGLSLHIGFNSKSTLYDYSKKVEFSHSIKSALTRIEKHHEIQVSYGDKCTGNIFVLKNFGWKDKQEFEQNINIQPTKYEVVGGDTDT